MGKILLLIFLFLSSVVQASQVNLETTVNPAYTGRTDTIQHDDVKKTMETNALKQQDMNTQLFNGAGMIYPTPGITVAGTGSWTTSLQLSSNIVNDATDTTKIPTVPAVVTELAKKIDASSLIRITTAGQQILECATLDCIRLLLGISGTGTVDPSSTDPLARDANLKALWLTENNDTDSVGTNDLTLSGSVTYSTVSPLQGTYSWLSAATSAYHSIADASLSGIDFSGSWSVGTRTKLTSDAADAKVISKWAASIEQREIDIARESSDDSIVVSVSGDGTNTQRVDLSAGANSWPINTRIDLVVTHDVSTHILRLYKNGLEVTVGNFPYTLSWVPFASGSSPLCIQGSEEDNSRGAIGQQDETWYYSAVMTPANILQWYNYGWGN